MTNDTRAIFLDIDGTLIPFGAEAPCEQDRAALLRARAAGHKVLINTGRSSGFLPPALRTADYLDGFLCGCGTQLIIGGKTLFKQEIPREALRQVLAYFLESPGEGCFFEGETALLTIKRTHPQGQMLTRADDFDTRFAGESVTKLTIWGAPTQQQRRLLAPWFDLICSERWYEAVLHGHGKGVGMEHACRALGVPVENSVAIGDSENDLDMFRHAGWSVAMGNASPAVQSQADWVTAPAGQGGIARVLAHIGI